MPDAHHARPIRWTNVGGAFLALGFAWLSLAAFITACTSTQAHDTVSTIKTAARVVEIPGINSDALVSYLQSVEDRVAELQAKKPEKESLSWQEWLFALTGGGAMSVAGSAVLDRRAMSKRSKSRAKVLNPILQVVDELAAAYSSSLPKDQREVLQARVTAAKQLLGKEAA